MREHHKNAYYDKFPDFNEFILVRIYRKFVKIQEFTLDIISLIFVQNDNLGFQIKVLKFLGIQPSYEKIPKYENVDFFDYDFES